MTSTQIMTQADQAQVDEAMQWLMRLPKLPPNEQPAIGEVKATVAALSEPVNTAWCMARVAALLSSYYDKDTPPEVRQMEAEDWLEALGEFPQWAIERAVRWWKSAKNAGRRKRPLEGDIAARCKIEMRGIGSLPSVLSRKAARSPRDAQPAPPRQMPTPNQARAIMEKAGIAVKGMTATEEKDQ